MKYQTYPAYKNSGVEWLGDVPEHWEITRVKFITECLDGSRIPLNAQERGDMQGDIPYWGANNIVDYVNDFLFDGDLILLGEDGAPFFDKTKNVAFNVSGKLWANNHVHVLRPEKTKIECRFLKHALNCADFYLYISGSTRDKLNQYDMNQIQIRICQLSEQQKIAQFLDHETAKIDTLIEKQQRLIELLKEKRQAVISHAVTKGLNPNAPMKESGVEWLGDVPEGWVVTRAKFVSTIFVPQRNKPELNDEAGVAWATMEDMKGTYIEKTKNYVDGVSAKIAGSKTLHAGAVIASCVGNFDVASINKIDVIINQQLQAFIPHSIKAEYLRETIGISKNYFELIGTAATLVYVNQQGFENLPVLLPTSDEQEQICEHIEKKCHEFQQLISFSEQAIELMQERRTALISAAVTGKIDVRDLRDWGD
jgi:type I restriction enzyme S subunit